MRRLQQEHGLVQSVEPRPPTPSVEIVNGVGARRPAGRRSAGIIGYRAKSHAGLIDIDRVGITTSPITGSRCASAAG
jgi:hypothetical protein